MDYKKVLLLHFTQGLSGRSYRRGNRLLARTQLMNS